MTMVYVKDEKGRTYALPEHIIEDFEISNVRLQGEASANGDRSNNRPPEPSLAALMASIEIEASVGELGNILGIDGGRDKNLPATLCAGVPGPRLDFGHHSSGVLPATLCGGVPRSGGSGGALLRFFSDPRLKSTRLRLKADRLSEYLYGEAM
jgi:hypothetical protein